MGHRVASFFDGIFKIAPIFLLKAGTFLVLLFTVGMAAGYAVAVFGITPGIFLVPVAAMLIMWYRLDEGVFVLILLILLVIFFPEVLNGLFSALL